MTIYEIALEKALRSLIDAAEDIRAAIDGATTQFDPELIALRRATKAGEEVLTHMFYHEVEVKQQ